MTSKHFVNASCSRSWCPPNRRGTSSLDLLVSFTLLVTVISVSTPLIVRHGRLLKSQRNYRLALDELSNQMDRLTTLSSNDLAQAVKQLSPSTFVTDRLPGAKLGGELQPAESGMRLTLTLSWSETERDRAPVTIAAWIFPSEVQLGKQPAEEAPQ